MGVAQEPVPKALSAFLFFKKSYFSFISRLFFGKITLH